MKESIDCYKYDHPLYPDKCINNIKIDESNPLLCPICFRRINIPQLLWTAEAKERWDRYLKKDAELNNCVDNYPENYIEYLAFKAATGYEL